MLNIRFFLPTTSTATPTTIDVPPLFVVKRVPFRALFKRVLQGTDNHDWVRGTDRLANRSSQTVVADNGHFRGAQTSGETPL